MPYLDVQKRRESRKKLYYKKRDVILAQERGYRVSNPEAYRRTRLKHRYGLTFEQHRAMFDSQGGRCALCKEKTAVDVDHCHDTGKIRGLLCRGCNVGLGQLGDTVDGLLRAIEYLRKE